MKNTQPPRLIVQQDLALDAYLSRLLDEIPEPVHETKSDIPAETLRLPTETPSQQVIAAPTPERRIAPVQRTVNIVPTEPPARLQALALMPDWTQHEFQALFFKLEHLILATPLTELSRAIKVGNKPGKIPGQPSWFIGLLDEHDSRIGVLDTGQLVFGKKRGGARDLESNPFKSILITRDKRWGLACDEILSIGRLIPEKVRWRTSRQKKPWLIGTVIDELTAIIDLQELIPHKKR